MWKFKKKCDRYIYYIEQDDICCYPMIVNNENALSLLDNLLQNWDIDIVSYM